MKRKFSAFLFFVLLSALSISICRPAMAASDKKAIQSTVKSFFSAVKKYDGAALSKNFQPMENRNHIVTYDTDGIVKSVKKMHKDYLKYKIQKVTVKKNSGTAKVKVTMFNARGTSAIVLVATSLYSEFSLEAAGAELYSAYTDMSKSGKKSHVITKVVTIPMIKLNGKWVIKDVTQDIAHIIDCGFNDAVEFIVQ